MCTDHGQSPVSGLVLHEVDIPETITLPAVDEVEIVSLVDNVTDALMTDQGPARWVTPGGGPVRPDAVMTGGTGRGRGGRAVARALRPHGRARRADPGRRPGRHAAGAAPGRLAPAPAGAARPRAAGHAHPQPPGPDRGRVRGAGHAPAELPVRRLCAGDRGGRPGHRLRGRLPAPAGVAGRPLATRPAGAGRPGGGDQRARQGPAGADRLRPRRDRQHLPPRAGADRRVGARARGAGRLPPGRPHGPSR